MAFYSNWTRGEKAVGVLFVLFIAYVIFNEIRKADWKAKLEAELAEIDKQIGSGRRSAGDLVDLKQKRNAIVEQYLKTL